MSSTDTGTSLRLTRVVKAPREEVFRAWTEPERLARWACPAHATIARVEVDLRVGGAYAIYMEGAEEGQEYTAAGTYREIAPPERLAFTWDWVQEAHRMGDTLVTVELHAVGDATEVVLSHEGFPAPDATAGHAEGWTSCLDRLEAHLA